jgi:hypothetical protein
MFSIDSFVVVLVVDIKETILTMAGFDIVAGMAIE